MPGTFQIIIKSIKFYKKPVLYQVLIIILPVRRHTGSLLTGRSVKESLKKSAQNALEIQASISSGIRYFDSELVQRMKDSSGILCTGILEMNGYCQSLNSQKRGVQYAYLWCQ